MNNLKSAIADKILDLSTSGGDEMRIKLEKINRFRDFADACRSLIQKYPAIELELLRMIESNDFDTKIASSRVDTIIRLSETNTPDNSQNNATIEKDINELEDIQEHLPTPSSSDIQNKIEEELQTVEEIPSFIEQESEPKLEDVDYEEVAYTPEAENDYVDFEEVVPVNNTAIDTSPIEKDPIEETQPQSKQETIKKGLLICGIIAVIIALIFIIKFVINNWQIILWIVGALIIIGIIGIVIKRNRE